MEKKEPRWYLLWFYTAAMWLIVFCYNFFDSTTRDFFTLLQFLNIWVSLGAGIVNARRYRKKQQEQNGK